MAGMYPPKNNNSGKQKPGNSDNTIKYCYNFNESGACRFGASCIYSHTKDPNHTKKIGIVGYWATSISTVRTTVLSEKVIKTDLFPDLDSTFRILDIIQDLRPSSRKICVLYRIVTVQYCSGFVPKKFHQYVLLRKRVKK